MLVLTAISSLLLPLASAAVIGQSQQPLTSETANLTVDLTVKKFAIDDMSDTKFRLHHVAARALLGDASYIVLREAEIEQRQQEIWQFLWNNELRCSDWGMNTKDELVSEYRPKIWFSDDRVFDADPAHVLQEVIAALEKLLEQEWKERKDMRRQRMCNVPETVDKDTMAMSRDIPGVPEADWHITIPEEYMQYLIPQSVIEEEDKRDGELWQERHELNRKNILAGTRSIRDMEMPDLSKCTKRERRMRHMFEGF
ncbi:hypothetical protein E4T50_16470 [Aureobasidium sp. EXF-12298]|nr:hypothetical protein E4T50_16470 [Aureobasidium sp. EXF-12298]